MATPENENDHPETEIPASQGENPPKADATTAQAGGASPKSNETIAFSSDPIIRAVQELNLPWRNHDHRKLTRQPLGRVFVYPVSFIGQDNWSRINYVITRGENDTNPRPFQTLEAAISSVSSITVPIWADASLLKLYTIIGLGVMIFAASCKLAFSPDESNALPVFTGLLGSIIGYFIGDRPASTKSDV